MQNGHQPSAPPSSCRTNFMAGGGLWSVDEEVEDCVSQFDAFLTGNKAHLQLTADHRPIFFSRELIKTWSSAWQIKQVDIKTASAHDTETLALRRR